MPVIFFIFRAISTSSSSCDSSGEFREFRKRHGLHVRYRFRVVELFRIRYIKVRVRIRILGSVKEIHRPGSNPLCEKSS
jgi:hypothetical protein